MFKENKTDSVDGFDDILAKEKQLQESHPEISSPKYWRYLSLMEATYQTLIKSIRVGGNREVPIKPEEVVLDWIKGCVRCKNLTATDIAEMKLFIPSDVAESDMVKLLKDFGLPDVLPAILYVNDRVGKVIGMEEREAGSFIRQDKFEDPENPFHYLGLPVAKIEEAKRWGRHETIHQMDILSRDREGLNGIITEILTYRADHYFANQEDGWTYEIFNISLFPDVDNYIRQYDQEINLTKAKLKVEQAIKAINKLDKIYGVNKTTQIILNSLSIDDLIKRAKEV